MGISAEEKLSTLGKMRETAEQAYGYSLHFMACNQKRVTGGE